jgi:hypothetical protein
MSRGRELTNWSYPSSSSSKTYTVKRWENGELTCDCPGWRFQRAGQERGCKHTARIVEQYAGRLDIVPDPPAPPPRSGSRTTDQRCLRCRRNAAIASSVDGWCAQCVVDMRRTEILSDPVRIQRQGLRRGSDCPTCGLMISGDDGCVACERDKKEAAAVRRLQNATAKAIPCKRCGKTLQVDKSTVDAACYDCNLVIQNASRWCINCGVNEATVWPPDSRSGWCDACDTAQRRYLKTKPAAIACKRCGTTFWLTKTIDGACFDCNRVLKGWTKPKPPKPQEPPPPPARPRRKITLTDDDD